MSKHTPGPWEMVGPMVGGKGHESSQAISEIVTAPDKNGTQWSIASVPQAEQRDSELFANARLIAAAPDLLEALQSMVQAHGSILELTESPTIKKARAAIAKATGEQT